MSTDQVATLIVYARHYCSPGYILKRAALRLGRDIGRILQCGPDGLKQLGEAKPRYLTAVPTNDVN